MDEETKLKRKLRNQRYRQKRKAKSIKEFKPSKQDIEARERNKNEEFQELVSRFGTSKEDCILFRRVHMARQEHGNEMKAEFVTFYFNHLSCLECQKWLKNQGFDLNAVGSKKYEELRGFEEAFQGSDSNKQMGENQAGWVSICPIHGCPLDKNGCPVCRGE